MKQRALAGAGRADDRDLLAGTHIERDAVDDDRLRPRRIGEAHVAQRDVAARRLRQGLRMARRGDLRREPEDLEQPLGGARGLRDVAPDLAQFAERAGGEGGVKHELAERARRDRARQHVMRAVPENEDDAGENEEDRDRGEDGARPRRGARRR